MEGLTLAEFMEKYPHNTNTTDRFIRLVEMAYHKDPYGASLDEFIERCLYLYGGTVAGAMVDFLYNNRD